MKLALIRRQFSATGGAELYLQRLLRALAERNHELHLFAESWEEAALSESRQRLGVRWQAKCDTALEGRGIQEAASGSESAVAASLCRRSPRPGGGVDDLEETWPPGVTLHSMRISATRAMRGLRFAEAVQNELAGEKFDCVFSLERTWRQDVYRAGDGVHRVWLERRRQFAPWWKKVFTGRSAFHRNTMALETQTFNPQNTRRIIVNSEMVQREILEHFRFPPERIHLVRNGVNTARFQNGKRAETRARFGVKDDEFLWLFVGSGWERKGLKFVLQAFELLSSPARRSAGLPRAKLFVVGKGRKPVPQSGIPRGAIFFEPVHDIENFYAAADLLVFPPIYEPSSNVVFEALTAGLPVVTSVNNGAAEVIQEDVTGNIVKEFWRPEVLAGVAEKWMQKPARVQINAAEFSLERNVSETLAVLELAAKENTK